MRASAAPDDCVIVLSVADVSKTFNEVNIQKAMGLMGYQAVHSEHAQTNWQVSSLTFSTSP
jgi:hypothetical protein